MIALVEWNTDRDGCYGWSRIESVLIPLIRFIRVPFICPIPPHDLELHDRLPPPRHKFANAPPLLVNLKQPHGRLDARPAKA